MKDKKIVLRCHLKELMEEYNNGEGISANKLATTINERRSTLNDLIANKDMETRHIPARLLAKLAFFFGVTLNDIFTVVAIDEETGEEIVLWDEIKKRNKQK